jgi:hypothetical protein
VLADSTKAVTRKLVEDFVDEKIAQFSGFQVLRRAHAVHGRRIGKDFAHLLA